MTPILPLMERFEGRPGILTVRSFETGWAWRLEGLHDAWRGPTESVPEALHRAAEASLLSMPEADWRPLRGCNTLVRSVGPGFDVSVCLELEVAV